MLVVAALLLINLGGIAAAAERSEHKSKNAQKLIATLNSIGINSKEIQKFIADTDAHIEGKYLYLNEQKSMGGTLALRYKLGGGGPSIKQLELRYAPDNSRLEVKAKTNSVMMRYHLDY